jgi:hypothetical protein
MKIVEPTGTDGKQVSAPNSSLFTLSERTGPHAAHREGMLSGISFLPGAGSRLPPS